MNVARSSAWVGAFLLGMAAAAFGDAPAKPVELKISSALPSDGRIESGKLDNGLTWMYRRHDNPPGRMYMLACVDTGSLNETEKQRGLAHFLEHMCFNGTEHFAPGELVKYFESIGMEFGAHLNASTGFDATRYILAIPNTEVEQIDKALMTLSDYMFRAKLLEEEIDKERNVVMEEWRRGQGAGQRIRDKMFEQVFAGTRFAERLPIGLPEVIQNAPRSEFEDYYRTWYRPERITVIMVGDAESKPYIPLIQKWFGDYKPQVPPREEQTPQFKPFTEQRAFVFSDAEYEGCEVELMDIRPKRPPVTDTEQYRIRRVERLGAWIVNRRLEERVQKGEAAYRNSRVGVGDFLNDAVSVSASASGEPEDWAKMLEELVIEVNRAREHGFTQRELDLAKSETIAGAERAVRTDPTRPARAILNEIARSVTSDEPVLSAQQELDLINQILPNVSLTEVNAAFASHFGAGNFAFMVTLPDKDGVVKPPADEVLAMARSALSRKTDPLQESEAPTTLLASEPTPGEVAEGSEDSDLNITSCWLSNGVRLHHRFMDYKKDSVMVSISLAGGRIEETADNLGITDLVSSALRSQPATSRLTSTHVRDLMTGKNINVGAAGGQDTLTFRVSGSPRDLDTGLQLVYALLTDGQIEQSAVDNWKKQQLEFIKQAQRMPEFKAAEAMTQVLAGGDPRLNLVLEPAQVEALDIAKAQAWFDRLRKNARIEVAVVGEIDKDETLKLVCKYLGSLPARSRTAEHLDKLRTLPRETGPYTSRVDVDTVTPKAMAIAGFIGCEATNVNDARALEIASKIISSRLIKSVREDQSLVYSIRAGSAPSEVYRDSGRFMTQAPCDPANADKVVAEAHRIFTEFAESGPSDEELENAKKQIENRLDEILKEPRYWSGVLSDFDYRNRSLENEKAEPTAYRPYTKEQVVKIFNKYYTPQRRFQAIAAPSTTATPEEPAKAEAPTS